MDVAESSLRLEVLDLAYEMVQEFSVSCEPKDFSDEDAERIAKRGEDFRRLGAAIKLIAARQAEESGLCIRQGHRSAGTWLAEKTGESTGSSISDLETMRAAERHPVVENALRRGDLSTGRARQIASAADQCPEEAERLVRESGEQNHDEFNKNVDKVRFSSRSEEDEVQRHERMRRARQCRLWTDEEGFGRLHAKLAPDAFAVLKANLERIERDVFDKARKEGAHESRQAYLADALVSMAKASGSETGGDGTTKSASTKTLVRIRVDLDALMRGYAEAGETCEIPGVGRVSVAIATSGARRRSLRARDHERHRRLDGRFRLEVRPQGPQHRSTRT